MPVRRAVLALLALLCCVPLVAGCATGALSAPTPGRERIALAMSYIGNDWQTEAQKLVLAEAATPPYEGRVDLRTLVSGADVEKQIAQLQQLVAQGYQAIVLYPISPTALNPVIRQACERHIVVIAYDAEVTEPCAYNVHINQGFAGRATAEFLAAAMHDRGNVALITGVPGTSVDTDRTAAAKEVFARRGIKIVDTCPGMWDQATAQQCMSQMLTAHPSDIDGVWTQVGYGAFLAYQAAHKPVPPMSFEADNGSRAAIAEGQVVGVSYSSPPYTGAYALKVADAILHGQNFPHLIQVPLPLVTRQQLKLCTDVRQGCNVFPPDRVSTGFFDSFYDGDLVPELCLSAAQSGQPCPGEVARPPQPRSAADDATSLA